MFNSESSPALSNVIFSGNVANNGGGMRNNNSSRPALINVTFTPATPPLTMVAE